MKEISNCARVVLDTISLLPTLGFLGLFIIPFISAWLNIYVNQLLQIETDNIIKCMIYKTSFNYLSWIVQQDVLYKQSRHLGSDMLRHLKLSKLYCGATIPGANEKQFEDLIEDNSKLRDFIFLIPLFWSTIVNFSFNIYMMKIDDSKYPIRILFALLCVCICGLLTWFADTSIYERTKPSTISIIKFGDHQYIKIKLSMGCFLDINFEINKQNKIDNQQKNQKYFIILLNVVINYISLVNKDIGQLHSFGNISWMIGSLADNLKSLQYYTYMNDFISFIKCMKYYKLDCDFKRTLNFPVSKIEKVSFVNASFGYYEDLLKNPTRIDKILNLTFTFKIGFFYYLEAPNGIGKSTMLRMFTSNLFSGDVFFGDINRKKLSFMEIHKNVFYIVQASEYTPKFSKEEIFALKGKDLWLEVQLGLSELFDKATVEMSGSQKKRMLLYNLLCSEATILLLDETLSELSTEDTPEIPEGGGWLTRVINTLIQWEKRNNKIIIMVGHGLRDLIPNDNKVVQLGIENTSTKTVLSVRSKK